MSHDPARRFAEGPAISVVGAGPAGLAVGYFARQRGIPVVIFEASDSFGGNCRTLRRGEFLFDTGAHRFHDKDREITAEMKTLLGDELRVVESPSQIVYRGRFIDFPLSPVNLLRELGVTQVMRASADFVQARLTPNREGATFESVVVRKYGRAIAEAFLLGYSEKLWGVPACRLAPAAAGKRLRGLDFRSFVLETTAGRRAKTEHLDGLFLYPRFGIGAIMERLAEACGPGSVQTRSRVTRILHRQGRVTHLEINGQSCVSVRTVVSTLPLPLLIGMLDPPAPDEIVSLAQRIAFQHVVLVVLFLNRPQVTPNASLYFPDVNIPFTRVYEPKNRSRAMAPPHRTCLVVEIPTGAEGGAWLSNDAALVRSTCEELAGLGLIKAAEVFDSVVYRLPYAYPRLELGYQSVIEILHRYLKEFSNLKTVGRSASFAYVHVHDLLREGRRLVEDFVRERTFKEVE